MPAKIHYDNGDTAQVIARMHKGGLHYIEFENNGETYFIYRTRLAEHGIIRVTTSQSDRTLWSLN